MDNLEHELRAWREAPVEQIDVKTIKTHEGLQFRGGHVMSFSERVKAEASSEAHIARFTAQLRANPKRHLDPILVVRAQGNLYVVDGHHRLKAYGCANRLVIPASVMNRSLREAAAVAGIVNLDATKLPLLGGSAREAAWQWLRLNCPRPGVLPSGHSLETVRVKFGIGSKATVSKMLYRMPSVEEELKGNLFSKQALNTATGWPLWKAVSCPSVPFADVPMETRRQKDIERCATGIVKLRDKFGVDVYRDAVRALLSEGRIEEADAPDVDESGDF